MLHGFRPCHNQKQCISDLYRNLARNLLDLLAAVYCLVVEILDPTNFTRFKFEHRSTTMIWVEEGEHLTFARGSGQLSRAVIFGLLTCASSRTLDARRKHVPQIHRCSSARSFPSSAGVCLLRVDPWDGTTMRIVSTRDRENVFRLSMSAREVWMLRNTWHDLNELRSRA